MCLDSCEVCETHAPFTWIIRIGISRADSLQGPDRQCSKLEAFPGIFFECSLYTARLTEEDQRAFKSKKISKFININYKVELHTCIGSGTVDRTTGVRLTTLIRGLRNRPQKITHNLFHYFSPALI